MWSFSSNVTGDSKMPKEIFDPEEFVALAEDADKCLIKKNPTETKLKLRTKKYLYTITLDPDEASDILSNINCTKEEI